MKKTGEINVIVRDAAKQGDANWFGWNKDWKLMVVEPDNEPGVSDEALAAAADWFLLLQEGPEEAALKARFDRWLCSDSEHRLAWERTHRAWAAMGQVRPAMRSQWEHAARSDARPIMRGPSATRRRAPWRRAAVAAALAGALCLGLVAAPGLMLRLSADYSTSTAETRTITLQDGSTVTMAAATSIALDYGEGRRGITLLAGEAYLEVAPDKDRPFRVEANGVRVEVLGTGFDVQVADGLTSIALAHGSVEASVAGSAEIPPERMVPGDLLTVDPNSAVMTKDTIPVDEIANWRNGELYVVNATLASVIAQIQRYHQAWISVPDAALARQRVTGFYNLKQPDQALRALVEPYGGKVRSISSLARIVSRY